jgi:hypothetical protein
MNIRNSIPIVANNLMAWLSLMMLSPLGPMIIPDTISPKMPGTLNFFRITGEISMMKRIMAKMRTGLFTGSSI